MILKKDIRAIGFDDKPFNKFQDKKSEVIGTVMRGNSLIEGFLKTEINVDGNDVTDKIIDLIKSSQFSNQIRVIFSDGITFAGFNVLDVFKVNEVLGIPIIVIIRREPNIERIKDVLKKLNKQKELELINRLPKAVSFNGIYYQNIGLTNKDSESLIKRFTLSAKTPEPIRISHLIGQMLAFNKSSGHA